MTDVTDVTDVMEPSPSDVPTPSDVAPAWASAMSAASPWSPPAADALLVVPHPDDESVMFGGVVWRLARLGVHVRIVAVTDGGAAYPDLVSSDEMAQVRRREQGDALSALGAREVTVKRLGIPDGEVAGHEALVRDALLEAIDERPVGLIVAPWELDHHTDHEACGRAAFAAWQHQADQVVLASGLFWSLLRERPPADVVLRSLELDQPGRAAKEHAISCHRSQVTADLADRPVLTARELALTRLPVEHYVVRGVVRGAEMVRNGGAR